MMVVCIKRVSILLVTAALITGVFACEDTSPGLHEEFNLIMAVTPPGCGTAVDLTDASPYVAGSAVNIGAEAVAGYHFAGWSAPAGVFADQDATETTFTMPAQNVTVTATFHSDQRYSLTLTVDPPGSGTAIDITDNSPYSAGVAVSVRAEAGTGYSFAGWSAPAGSLADENAAETTFAMPAQDVTITATFAEGQAILTWNDLHAIRDDLTGTYFLMNDLDSTTADYAELAGPGADQGRGWQPIGSRDTGFAGTFDARGHEIRDLFIDRADEDGVGLFGVLDKEGMIKNVSLQNATVTGGNYVGSLVGDNWEGTVTNCRSSGIVTGENYAGGLVGISDGTISGSYSTSSVTGDFWVGGILGCNEGMVSNCYSTGSVTGDWGVGGLVGDNYDGTVSGSYSTGSVTGNWWNGGLVGVNTGGTVSDSFWNTMTSGMGESDGGTGKTTEEMMSIATFADQATVGLDAPWDIAAVADPSQRTPGTSWNIVDGLTYPFLSWEPVS